MAFSPLMLPMLTLSVLSRWYLPRLGVPLSDEMRETFQSLWSEALQAATAGGEVERHVERIAAAPVTVSIVVAEDINPGAGRDSQHRYQRRQ